MIDPELIVTAVVNAIRSIPEVTALMGIDDPLPARPRISGFYYESGDELPFNKVIYEIPQPGVLVLWRSTLGGNFDGATVFKHMIEVYIRSGNMALSPTPTGPAHLWWLICNKPILGGSLNLRQVRLLSNLDPVDTPTITHRQDENLLDFFCGTLVFPEVGDD